MLKLVRVELQETQLFLGLIFSFLFSAQFLGRVTGNIQLFLGLYIILPRFSPVLGDHQGAMAHSAEYRNFTHLEEGMEITQSTYKQHSPIHQYLEPKTSIRTMKQVLGLIQKCL